MAGNSSSDTVDWVTEGTTGRYVFVPRTLKCLQFLTWEPRPSLLPRQTQSLALS